MRRRSIGFSRVFVVSVAFVAFILSAPIAANAATCTCSISLSPTSGSSGSSVTVAGSGFTAGGTVHVQFVDSAGARTLVSKKVAVNSAGGFSVTVTVPSTAAPGAGKLVANEKLSGQRAKAPFMVT
jgi:hypothetical protein